MANAPWWALFLPLLGVTVGALLTFWFQTVQANAAQAEAERVRKAEWDRQDAKEAKAEAQREADRKNERLHAQMLQDRDHLLAGLRDVHAAVTMSVNLVALRGVVDDPTSGPKEIEEFYRASQEWGEAQRMLRTFTAVAASIDKEVSRRVYELREQLRQSNEEEVSSWPRYRQACDDAVVDWMRRQRLVPQDDGPGATAAQTAPHETRVERNGTGETGDASK